MQREGSFPERFDEVVQLEMAFLTDVTAITGIKLTIQKRRDPFNHSTSSVLTKRGYVNFTFYAFSVTSRSLIVLPNYLLYDINRFFSFP